MKIEIASLQGLTLKFLDENISFIDSRMEFSEPESPLESLIEALLPDAARAVIREAQLSDIDESEDFDADPDWIVPGRGTVELPADFLRLVSFRMSDWRRAVSTPIDPEGEEYSLHCATSPFGHGRRKGPAVALPPGSRCLEFFGSTEPGAYVESARYIPDPEDPDDNRSLRIPRSLVTQVASATAERIRKIRS